MPVEDVQNKIRNKLSPIVLLNDLIKTLKHSKENTNDVLEYIFRNNLDDIINNNISDIIDIAEECDKKINDNTFDVWANVINKRTNEYD